jgi:hypothetical protein
MIKTTRTIKGWIKHSEDEIAQIYTLGHPKIAPYVSLIPIDKLASNYMINLALSVPIDNQANYGCCTGEEATGVAKIVDLIINEKYTELSVLANYYWSRLILNGKAPTGDDGATILSSFQAMMSPYGNAPDTDWPFTSPLNTKPSAKALTDAVGYSLIKYFTIPEDSTKDPTKNTKILTMKQVLSANSPLGFGSDVDDTIMNVGSDGKEPYKKNPLVNGQPAGHARVIIGYDDTIVIPGAPIKGAFRVRNSWDKTWGDEGYSWVSYQVFIDQQTDCMGVTSENYPSNNPVPPITPSVNVPVALANAQTAYKQSSIAKAKPYIKLTEINLGG